jgi:hypothetical protein
MALSKTPKQQILDEMEADVCPACSNAKQAGQSFCRVCYFNLEVPLRQSLYKRFGHGYEEAYMEAKEYLVGEIKAKRRKNE